MCPVTSDRIAAQVVVALLLAVVAGCERSSFQIEQDLAAALRQVCAGQGVESAAPYPDGRDVHPVFGIDAEGQPALSNAMSGTAWRPTAVAEVELVACVETVNEVVLEECVYVAEDNPDGGQQIVERRQYDLHVRLLAARSANLVAERTFSGTPPGPCPDRAINRAFVGPGAPDNQTMRSWLADFVESGL